MVHCTLWVSNGWLWLLLELGYILLLILVGQIWIFSNTLLLFN